MVSLRAARAGILLLCLGRLAAGCGGGDPLPAGGPDPALDVRVSTAEGGAFDGVIWLTREDAITLLGEAPASSMVEAIREGDGVLAGSARAEADGRFAVRVPALPAVTTYLLQARPASGAPGRPTAARVQQRRAPPEPFTLDPLPAATGGSTVRIEGSTASDVLVLVRAKSPAGDEAISKPLGETRFGLDLPLAPDRPNDLTITGADLVGNETAPVAATVVQDSTAPPPPSLGPGRPVSALRPTLEGRAPEASRVEVDTPADGRLVAGVDGAGAFAFTASLPVEGENVFLGIAFDAVGNRSEAARTVVVRDTLPPAVPADLAVANAVGVHQDAVVVGSRTATIVGRAEAGAAVEASGDGILAPPTTAAGDGGFRVDVTLPSPFVIYTVRVEAVDAAGNRSGAASVRVVSFSLFGFSP